MGILSNVINRKPESQEVVAPAQQAPQQTANDLSRAELELLLKILGDATLKGREVEVFYHMILKIQNQYIARQ